MKKYFSKFWVEFSFLVPIIMIVAALSVFSFQACSQVEPIAEEVCSITTDICAYAQVICEQFNNNKLNDAEKSEIKSDLMQIKKILEAKIQNIKIESMKSDYSKQKYLSAIQTLKQTTLKLDEFIKQKVETAKE